MLNIEDGLFCRVCGLRQMEAPWGHDGRTVHTRFVPAVASNLDTKTVRLPRPVQHVQSSIRHARGARWGQKASQNREGHLGNIAFTANSDQEAESAISSLLCAAPDPVARDMDDFHIGCLFARYLRRELSWASFLDLAGRYADQVQSERPCEFFFEMLNELEKDDFSRELEQSQRVLVEGEMLEGIHQAAEFLRSLSSGSCH